MKIRACAIVPGFCRSGHICQFKYSQVATNSELKFYQHSEALQDKVKHTL